MSAMTLESLCKERTALTDCDIALLQSYADTLPVMANLVRGDMFIDCEDMAGGVFVAAQASPVHVKSKYTETVVGAAVLPDDEPAVFHAFASGLPCHDTVANTQENVTVRQDVAPIKNACGETIGVMIAELDISREVSMERKLDAIDKEWQVPFRRSVYGSVGDADAVKENESFRQESNHRIKNHLQLMASSCNIKARASTTGAERQAYMDCSGMAMAVAKLHEQLSFVSGNDHPVKLSEVIQSLLRGLGDVAKADYDLDFQYEGSDWSLPADIVMTIALCTNELVVNAIKYAATERPCTISVLVGRGHRFGSVTVTDNGAGFDRDEESGMGFRVVSAMVRDKLGGELTLASDDSGTTASFTFAASC